MDKTPPAAALHIKIPRFRVKLWVLTRAETGDVENDVQLAPTVQKKALDLWRLVSGSGRLQGVAELRYERELWSWRGASSLSSFLQTLVHQRPWVQHVALRVEELGEILRYLRPRSHVGHAGADRHHFGDLLLHLTDLSVLLLHFICQSGKRRHEDRNTAVK